MTTMLVTPNGSKNFNSYYLALIEKEKLRKKGVAAKVVEVNDTDPRYPPVRDCKLRTIYTEEDRKKLKKLRLAYDPALFEKDYRKKSKTKNKEIE